MRLLLLGGAPGAGKNAVARELLALAQEGPDLIQWVDVDALWLHQPWRVDGAVVEMLHANLAAVLMNADRAGVDMVIVTWVYQDSSFHHLVRRLGPRGAQVVTAQLVLDEARWRERFAADAARPAIDAFFETRYRQAQTTPADHVLDVGLADAAESAAELWERLTHPGARTEKVEPLLAAPAPRDRCPASDV